MRVRHKSAIRRVSRDLHQGRGELAPADHSVHGVAADIDRALPPQPRTRRLRYPWTATRSGVSVPPYPRWLDRRGDKGEAERPSADTLARVAEALSWLRSSRMLEFCQSGLFLGEKAKQRQPFRRICFGGQLTAIVFDVQLSDDDPLVHHGGSL